VLTQELSGILSCRYTGMTDSDSLLRLVPQQNKDFALILLDEHGFVIDWLMGAKEIFGYEKAEILGKGVDQLFTPEDRARQVPQGELEIGTKYGQQEDDRWLMRKDGVRFWASGVLTCLKDTEGKTTGFSKILRDRTDMKEHIDLLRNRTRALETENQQKMVMMGTLAHELRNPLGALANAAQLIEIVYPQDKKLVPTTQLIKRQVRYLSTLIEDLLENVRLQTGKVVLQTKPTDLLTLLTSAIESVSPTIREKRQKIELLLPQPPITLNVDPTRLKQVFINLLSNASKFSGETATIWIKAMTEDNELVLRVEDEGRGIPSDLLPHLFELFSQGETNDQHSYSGLGLGLAIVKQYVELHGGSMQARSEGVGRGSQFIVRLPLMQK
jgi:PAS domain S-box-containing protein